MRILVIEDHATLGRFISASLTSAGWTVIGPFADHASAMRAVRRRNFDVAVLDRMLQGEEALAVADALVAAGIRCLLISGYPRTSLPARLRHLPFLEKPFRMAALLAAVRATDNGRENPS